MLMNSGIACLKEINVFCPGHYLITFTTPQCNFDHVLVDIKKIVIVKFRNASERVKVRYVIAQS